MPDPLLLLGLLTPLAALLFLNLRRRRRITYPHQLLLAEGRRGRSALILGALRAHADLLVDLGLALVVAFALAPPGPGRKSMAIVVDATASLLRGAEGSRPLDKALDRARALESSGGKVFLLAADPRGGGSRLYPLKSPVPTSLPAGLGPLLGNDHGALAGLGASGFRRVVLLTDQGGLTSASPTLAVENVAPDEAGLPLYGSRIVFDAGAKAYRVTFAVGIEPFRLALGRLDPKSGAFVSLPPGEAGLTLLKDGWEFRLPAPGLYRLTVVRREGETEERLAFRLLPPLRPASARGPFSELMAAALPELRLGSKAGTEVLLVDAGPGAVDGAAATTEARRVRAHGGLVVESRRGAPSSGLLLAPGLGGGRPLLSGLPGGVKGTVAPGDLALDLSPESLANDDLPLAYEGILEAHHEPSWITAIPAGSRLRYADGTPCIVDRQGLLPVNPPPEEFFLSARERLPALLPPDRARWPWAFALGLLMALKLVLARLRRVGGGGR